MIRTSTVIAVVAILLSMLVHFLGLSFTSPVQPERSAENTGTDAVALGNAFEDVAEALSEPVAPESAPVPDTAAETSPETEFADTPTTEALVASADPQRAISPDAGAAKTVQPDTTGPFAPENLDPSDDVEEAVTDTTLTPPVEPTAVTKALESKPAAITEPIEVVTAEPVLEPSVTPVLPVTPAPEPSVIPVITLERETVEPETPETTIEPAPDNSVTAKAEVESGGSELAVLSSIRPQLPSRPLSAEVAELQDGSSEPSEVRPAQSQLIESPLTAYQRDGTDLTILQNSGTRSRGTGDLGSGTPGNSDATNYAGRVLIQLNRTPTVPISVRGFARVLFEINLDGTLARVDIIDGTGSLEINRAAKAQVQNAAPFPRPPQGASRKLTFVYRIN